MKTVIVINGQGGVGKDTLCTIAGTAYAVRNISSITPIKDLARITGWSGQKDDRSRKFLADLKQLTVAYNDYPLRWLEAQYADFLTTGEQILFVHIREPGEIAKFVGAIRARGGEILTLLVRGGKRYAHRRRGAFGNDADDCVEQYDYDGIFENGASLEETPARFLPFLDTLLREGKARGC